MRITTFFQWLTVFGMFCACACSKPEKDYHPEYFGKYFAQFDSTFVLAKRDVILDSLESLLHRYPAGDGDKVRYYRSRTTHYMNTRDFVKLFYISIAQSISPKKEKTILIF